MSERSPSATLRAVPLAAGVALLVLYARIGSVIGFQAGYGPPFPPYDHDVPSPFVYVTGSEFRFWLAHLVLAVPAALLIAWGLAPRLAPALQRLVARVDRAPARSWWIAGIAMFAVLCVWSIVGRHLVLLDLPITDDENAAQFGARMLATGRLGVPLLQPPNTFVDMFTYQHAGLVSSMDFPGVLMFGALAIVTHLGTIAYALAAAASGVAVAYAAGRWLGPRARVVAAAIWIASPMIASLSLTNHGHIPSRMFIALALVFAARLDTAAGTPRRDAILLGVVAGAAFLCRPFEALCLLAPIGACVTIGALRKAPTLPRATPLWLLCGFVPLVAVFAWYNLRTTGVWYLQARFSPGVIGGSPSTSETIWDRVGLNLGWNALMLAVFFLGIPAIVAVAGAIDRRRPFTIVLALGVLGVFLLCLTHDNTGIHSVGPIHFSETAVPLTVLATAGLMRGFAWLAAKELPRAPAAALLAGYLVLACGSFGASNLASLRMQAGTQAAPFETLAAIGVHHAIVIAPPYIILLQVAKAFAPWGSWVLDYPHPDPDLEDDVLFAKPTANPEDLHARFPDRAIVKMTYSADAPPIRAVLLYAPR